MNSNLLSSFRHRWLRLTSGAGDYTNALVVDTVGAPGSISPAGAVFTIQVSKTGSSLQVTQVVPGSPMGSAPAGWNSWDQVFVRSSDKISRLDLSSGHHVIWV